MIIGTAGHIDHGKTTLVRALTGVDTDRLPEEKKRGITIELGYAFMPGPGPVSETGAAGDPIGFIDVPGHERLVHTMLAGATGIDFALLLVAADDGVMPQTREHLAVLALLGIARGAVVITKADRADPAAALAQARALVEGTPLAGAPMLAVSAQTGAGIAELKALLLAAAADVAAPGAAAGVAGATWAAATAAPPGSAAFRLAVDRAFTLSGTGTVVTGTVHAGAVEVGDHLRLVPGGSTVRVRSVHAQNRPAARARAGERCALALAGVAKDDIARGQWLVAPAAAVQAQPGTAQPGETQRIDARLTLWHAEPRALRSGTVVHVHLGAAATQGTVALLDGEALQPGASGRVQLVLRTPIGAWVGDRVVLRDASASRTLAGGAVLDPFAPARYRRAPQRLAALDALAAGDLPALLALAPVELPRLEAALGRPVPALPEGTLRGGDWAFSATLAAETAHTALATLASFHLKQPDDAGPDVARLRRLAAPRLPEVLWRALLSSLQTAGRVVLRGAFVQLPEHGARLSAADQRIAKKVAPLLALAGVDGAWARDLARDANEPEPLLRSTLARLTQRGELHQVVKDLYFSPAAIAALAGMARAVAGTHAGQALSTAAFRDRTQLGRKRAIQLLEYFDRIGWMRRVGEVRKVRAEAMPNETVT